MGVRNLKRVAPKHILAYLAELDNYGLAGVTRRKKLTIIRTFFGWLQRIVMNPHYILRLSSPEDDTMKASLGR